MNAPKLIAKAVVIIVLALIVFTAIWSAVPKSVDHPPIDFKLDGDFEMKVDDSMNLEVSVPPITFFSTFPQDIRDFIIDIYVGTGGDRLPIGEYNAGTISSNESVTVQGHTYSVPIVTLQASIPGYQKDGRIILEMTADVTLKYGKILGMNLLDIDLGLILDTGQTAGAVIEGPYIDGNEAEFTVVSTEPDSILSKIVKEFDSQTGGAANATCAGMTVDIISDSGKQDSLSVVIDGGTEPPYEILQEQLDEEGKLSFTYEYGSKTGTFTLTKEQAEQLIKVLTDLYNKVVPS